MAQAATRIETELLDEPHVVGRRISVRQLYDLIEEAGLDPGTVADRYDLDVADVYHALAYYYDNPREMAEVRERRSEAYEEFRERVDRPADVRPS